MGLFFRALPLKGITWPPHLSHPLFIGVTLYCMLYCISVFILLEAATVLFVLPRVVFLPPTLPVSGFLSDRVVDTEVYFFACSLTYTVRVFGCGNKLLSWPKTNSVVGGDNYDVWWSAHVFKTILPLFFQVDLDCWNNKTINELIIAREPGTIVNICWI